MADAQELASVAPAVPSAVAPDADKPEAGASSSADDAPSTTADEAKADAPAAASEEVNGTTDKQPSSEDSKPEDQAEKKSEDVEMKDQTTADSSAAGDDSMVGASAGTPSSAKQAKGRRKSGVPEHNKKKLQKKASKAKILHTDVKPGDHYLVRLKGYPLWPAIAASEEMLPDIIRNNRPVTAARPDGSYREDFADGGKRVAERTYPMMYLATNEFGWIPNTDLIDLDLDNMEPPAKSRKDLVAAYELAAEKHDVDYYQQVLDDFQESKKAEAEAKEAAKAKKASKGKRKSTATIVDGDDDIEMPDADLDADEEETSKEAKPKSKKRKAVDEADAGQTPQRSESVKKTKIKLTSKSNGATATPKSTKKDEATPKTAKSAKSKKAAKAGSSEVATPKEPEEDPEQKRLKKEKEILFLRHKLQKGLLTRDVKPKPEEMKQMSEYIAKLEGYAELEVSIIRATKINKVLKAIKKLDEIPKEDEFNFKSRSETLLQKWNKILESETGSPNAAAATNGTTNGDAAKAAPEKETTETKPEAKPEARTNEPNTEAKVEPTESTNGVTESKDEEKPKAEHEADTVMEDAKPESAPKEESATGEPSTDAAPAESAEPAETAEPVAASS